MFNVVLKKLTVPSSNETKQVDAVQLWEVRWRSRNGEYHSDTRPEVETFTSEKEAEAFKKALENAFALTKTTSDGARVTIRKAK